VQSAPWVVSAPARAYKALCPSLPLSVAIFLGRLFQQDVRARNLIFCKTIAHGNRARPRTVAALGAPASLQIRLLVQQLTKRNFTIELK